MRSFYACIFKNIIWIYLCILICFSYGMMMKAIPGHVYLEQGQTLSFRQQIPVEVAMCEHKAQTFADVGTSTYEGILNRRYEKESRNLSIGSHEMMCYLFGVFPIKEVEVSVVESTSVYPSGHVIGIYGVTNGVFVLGSSPVELADGSHAQPVEHVIFPGDYILAVNRHKVTSKEELTRLIRASEAETMVLTVLRGDEEIEVSVQPVLAKNTQDDSLHYMLGIWVKDDMAGIGTMTYYDENGNYGALGHGIGDGETGELLRIAKGYLYEAHVLGIRKGRRGDPGELQGVVYYGRTNQLGNVTRNSDIGIYGKLNEECINGLFPENELYVLAYKQDVKAGDAYILSDASGVRQAYHIIIDSFDYSPSDRNKGIRFHVDDADLLSLTGGIVQGLSGSPIIQDGRLIGGVTHVLINDPTRGYGIFAETMLEDKN